MNVEYDRQADAVYVKLSDKIYSYGIDVDDRRHIDYAVDGTPIGVELLSISRGANMTGLPQAGEISASLRDEDFMTCTIEDRSNVLAESENVQIWHIECGKTLDSMIIESVELRHTLEIGLEKPLERIQENTTREGVLTK